MSGDLETNRTLDWIEPYYIWTTIGPTYLGRFSRAVHRLLLPWSRHGSHCLLQWSSLDPAACDVLWKKTMPMVGSVFGQKKTSNCEHDLLICLVSAKNGSAGVSLWQTLLSAGSFPSKMAATTGMVTLRSKSPVCVESTVTPNFQRSFLSDNHFWYPIVNCISCWYHSYRWIYIKYQKMMSTAEWLFAPEMKICTVPFFANRGVSASEVFGYWNNVWFPLTCKKELQSLQKHIL